MAVGDIAAVMTIDRLAFTAPWKASGYEYEITANEIAHYQVLLYQDARTCLVGYVGHWLMSGEAHISTLAVHPAWQGMGLGEALLLRCLDQATRQGAGQATLEVRRSNIPAQKLYKRYRFQQVGVRPRYYRDNREDALILTSPPFDASFTQFLGERATAVAERLTHVRREGRPCVQLGVTPAPAPAETQDNTNH